MRGLSHQRKYDVVGFGALNVDEIIAVDRVQPDDEVVSKGQASSPGGSAANTIHALAKLGARTAFIGAVGADPDGSELLAAFDAEGVDTSSVARIDGVRSGQTVIIVSPQENPIHRFIVVSPRANSHFRSTHVHQEIIENAGILHISSFVDDEQFDIQRKVVTSLPEEVLLSFSPGRFYADRGLKALEPFIERSDFVFLNQSELRDLTRQAKGLLSTLDGAKTLLRLGAARVIVTLGAGEAPELATPVPLANPQPVESKMYAAVAYERTGETTYILRASPRGKALESKQDTVGAGDAFAAGFLWSFVSRSPSLEDAGYAGQVLAELSLMASGARAFNPTPKKIESAMRKRRNAGRLVATSTQK